MTRAFWSGFDPRAKTLFLVAATAAVLLAPPAGVALGAAAAFALAVPVLGGRRSLVVLRTAVVLWGFTLLANAIFQPGARLGPSGLGWFRPSVEGLRLGALQGLRLVALAALGAWGGAVVRAFDLITSLEWGVRKRAVWRARVHRIGLPVLLAFRLVPLLAGEAVRIAEVERLRFGRRPWRTRVARLASLAPVWMTTTLERAEDLATALRLRGYRPDGERSFARAFRFRLRDGALAAAGVTLAVLAAR